MGIRAQNDAAVVSDAYLEVVSDVGAVTWIELERDIETTRIARQFLEQIGREAAMKLRAEAPRMSNRMTRFRARIIANVTSNSISIRAVSRWSDGNGVVVSELSKAP